MQHAKLITTRLVKLHIGGKPARLVGSRGYRESHPLASFPALHSQKGVCSTGVRTSNPNGSKGRSRVRHIPQLNSFTLRRTVTRTEGG